MSEEQAAYDAEPMTMRDVQPKSMLQLWFSLTHALEYDPDTIVCLAMFDGDLGVVVGDWSNVDELPTLLQRTKAQRRKR